MRRRPISLVVLVALAALIGAQLLATPVARWYARREFGDLRGYSGRVADVRASLLPPSLHAERLVIVQEPGGHWSAPLLYVERADVAVEWKELLHGRLVAVASLDRPKVNAVEDERTRSSGPSQAPDVGSELARMAPLRVDVLRVHDGALDFVTRPSEVEVWVHAVQMSVENLATRPRLSRGEPARMQLTGEVQHSGALAVTAQVYPWEQRLTFAGRAELRHFSAADIQSLGGRTADVKPSSGSIDVLAEFRCQDGALSGGVKPVTHHLTFEPANTDLWSRIKSSLADVTMDVLGRKGSSSEGGEVATVIPIRGRITDPKAQAWPTLLGIVRNAFVEGIGEGFQGVPPETAPRPQSPAEQALQAMKKQSGPPKAQPQGRAPAGG